MRFVCIFLDETKKKLPYKTLKNRFKKTIFSISAQHKLIDKKLQCRTFRKRDSTKGATPRDETSFNAFTATTAINSK